MVAQAESVLYVLGEYWRDRGGRSVGVYRVALPDGNAELLVDAHFEAGWISHLVGIGPSATDLCIVCASGPLGPNELVRYSACALDVANGSLRELTELPAVFA